MCAGRRSDGGITNNSRDEQIAGVRSVHESGSRAGERIRKIVNNRLAITGKVQTTAAIEQEQLIRCLNSLTNCKLCSMLLKNDDKEE